MGKTEKRKGEENETRGRRDRGKSVLLKDTSVISRRAALFSQYRSACYVLCSSQRNNFCKLYVCQFLKYEIQLSSGTVLVTSSKLFQTVVFLYIICFHIINQIIN